MAYATNPSMPPAEIQMGKLAMKESEWVLMVKMDSLIIMNA